MHWRTTNKPTLESGKNNYDPPCLGALSRHQVVIYAWDKIGASCPFRASHREILELAKRGPAATGDTKTRAVLAFFTKNLKAAAASPESVGIYQATEKSVDGLGHHLNMILPRSHPELRKLA